MIREQFVGVQVLFLPRYFPSTAAMYVYFEARFRGVGGSSPDPT